MSEPTKEAIEEALQLREKFVRGIFIYAPELAKIIAHIRTQATNDTLNAVRKCEQRSGTCLMVHSILHEAHPDVCDAENCDSIRAMKVPT